MNSSSLHIVAFVIVFTLLGCQPSWPAPAWTQAATLSSARIGHTATLLKDHSILIVGGWNGSEELGSVEIYNPSENTFTPVGSMHSPRTNHTATLLPDGRVLVVGGQFQGHTLAGAELYDPTTASWVNTGNLHLSRSYHTATLLNTGQVLITGGNPLGIFPG